MIPLLMERGPEKARFGEPCSQCGLCCAAEVCGVGRALYGEDQPAPCPALTFDGGRFWCGAVGLADRGGFGPELRFALGIGVGCDSADFTGDAARA